MEFSKLMDRSDSEFYFLLKSLQFMRIRLLRVDLVLIVSIAVSSSLELEIMLRVCKFLQKGDTSSVFMPF